MLSLRSPWWLSLPSRARPWRQPASRPTQQYDKSTVNLRYGRTASRQSATVASISRATAPQRSHSVTVTLSSWACQTGTWQHQTCQTDTGATFAQPITLTIFDGQHNRTRDSSTQTFAVPYRPSASPKCLSGDPSSPGGWYRRRRRRATNGLADVRHLQLLHVTLPSGSADGQLRDLLLREHPRWGHRTPSGLASPADSLNVAVTAAPSVGQSTVQNIWLDGMRTSAARQLHARRAVQGRHGS